MFVISILFLTSSYAMQNDPLRPGHEELAKVLREGRQQLTPFHSSNAVKALLALPDTQVQKEWLTPEVRTELNLKENQFVSIRAGYNRLDVQDFDRGGFEALDVVRGCSDKKLHSNTFTNQDLQKISKTYFNFYQENKAEFLSDLLKGYSEKFSNNLLFKTCSNSMGQLKKHTRLLLNSTEDLENIVEKAFKNIFKTPDNGVIPDGPYMYAMDEHGSLRIMAGERGEGVESLQDALTVQFFVQKIRKNFNKLTGMITHYHLFGGKNVFSAGVLRIKDGQITSLSNESGHYRPGAHHLAYTAKLLEFFNKSFLSHDFCIQVLSHKGSDDRKVLAEVHPLLKETLEHENHEMLTSVDPKFLNDVIKTKKKEITLSLQKYFQEKSIKSETDLSEKSSPQKSSSKRSTASSPKKNKNEPNHYTQYWNELNDSLKNKGKSINFIEEKEILEKIPEENQTDFVSNLKRIIAKKIKVSAVKRAIKVARFFRFEAFKKIEDEKTRNFIVSNFNPFDLASIKNLDQLRNLQEYLETPVVSAKVLMIQWKKLSDDINKEKEGKEQKEKAIDFFLKFYEGWKNSKYKQPKEKKDIDYESVRSLGETQK